MIVVDSSGWMHYFMNGELADAYAGYLSKLDQVLTPTIVLYEVVKKIKVEFGEEQAFLAAAEIGKTHLVPLTETVALNAAHTAVEHKLAMADSIIYATAVLCGARLVTSDADFKHLPNVLYLEPEDKS